MSDQEQDASIGRFIVDHAENKRKLEAMSAELERYEKAFAALADSCRHNVAADVTEKGLKRDLERHAVLARLDLAALTQFVEEYTMLRRSIDQGTARLRRLGV